MQVNQIRTMSQRWISRTHLVSRKLFRIILINRCTLTQQHNNVHGYMVMCRELYASKGFSPSQEGLPRLWVRNKTVSLESVPISYLTMQRMSLSLLWPFPSHILRPPFPFRLVTDLTVSTPIKKQKK